MIAWSVAMRDDGTADYLLPILPCTVLRNSDELYALRWPDGTAQCLEPGLLYRNTDEWSFDNKVLACSPHGLAGSA